MSNISDYKLTFRLVLRSFFLGWSALIFTISYGQVVIDTTNKEINTNTKDSTRFWKGNPKPNVYKKIISTLYGSSGDKTDPDGLKIAHFLAPGYSPDTKYALAAGVVASFKTKKNDSLLPMSSVPLTVSYSSAKAFIISLAAITMFNQDKFRLSVFAQYRNQGNLYYGTGYNTAVNVPKDSAGFWNSNLVFALRPLWRLKKNVFGGVVLLYDQSILSLVSPYIKRDPVYLKYNDYYRNSGLGVSIAYDTRDVAQNAYKGVYASVSHVFFEKAFGGTTKYQIFDLDTRTYLPLNPNRVRTLALTWHSRYFLGDPPAPAILPLGLPLDLRGVAFLKFRDYYTNYFMAEYRHKFYSKGVPSKWGFVTWAGLGTIGGDFNDALFKRAIPNVGVGLRFEILPRLNVRVDFGYSRTSGKSSNATFFNFLEAY